MPPGGELPLPLFQSLPPLALLLPAAEPPPPAVEPPPPGDQYSRNLFLKVKKEHDDKRKKEEADRLREEQERQAAEFAPPPLPPPLETLPAELTPLKLSAAAQGVRADAIEQLDASDSPKQAAISLLLHEKKKEPIPTAQSAAGEVVVDAEPKFGVVAATPEPGLPVSLSSTTAVTRCSCNSLSSFAVTQCRKPAVLLRRRAAATVGPRSTASRVTRTLSAKGSTFLLCASTACSVLRVQCEGQHLSAMLPLPVLFCASTAFLILDSASTRGSHQMEHFHPGSIRQLDKTPSERRRCMQVTIIWFTSLLDCPSLAVSAARHHLTCNPQHLCCFV